MNSRMDLPYFSIVIPSYNRGHMLKDVVEMALKQDFPDFEIIIVDDGSTDNTRDVVAAFSDMRLKYVYQENKERAAARNRGGDMARGRYVTFCDSDDLLYPHYLDEASRIIAQHGEVPWFHLGYEIIRDKRPVLKMNADHHDFISVLARGNPLSCLGVFIRKEVFENVRFNESRQMSGSEDWELWLRLSARYPIVHSKRICAALISHEGRSVIQTSELKLQLRKFLSIGYALEDKEAAKVYGPYRAVMRAHFDTYIALHLLLEGKSWSSTKYVFKAFREYPPAMFTRRMLAIIRLFFTNLFKRK